MLAMDHALNISEILRLILDDTDRPTQAAASLTCRRWSDIALSSLWCELDSILPVLKLYGELKKGSNALLVNSPGLVGLVHIKMISYFILFWISATKTLLTK